MQRFLTEARWSGDTVIGRLQEYLAPRLGHPEAVLVFDGSDFPKQGRKSAGVARQYCGRLGKAANCQAGMFLACVSPLGRALEHEGRLIASQDAPPRPGALRSGNGPSSGVPVPHSDPQGPADSPATVPEPLKAKLDKAREHYPDVDEEVAAMTVSAPVRKPTFLHTFLQRERWMAVQESKRRGCPCGEWRGSWGSTGRR